ncbi:cytochrome b/b6 domain-containing protein [Pelomonas sp. SE-A7]|uniref:cytochrome b n=1 Tax=Pelomonas sp. SE-A7 TaxID=3054953 RepID=UPI00259CCC01|nr:cytochrome b/b6 domain-containing protein [Pelomonas sp. SE-A7]MDM4766924.1 cytochrome b/b6 domain-containing protein [Pelomonas sp. SE-A7]
MNQATQYDSRSIRLHWISALLVLCLWVAGQTIDAFPRGTPRITVRSLHICFGVVLGLVVLFRLYWRFGGRSERPNADPGLPGRLAHAMHDLLYLLMVVTVGAGLLLTLLRGDNLFNLYKITSIAPDNKALRHDVKEVHELAANLMLALALLHAAAAVWHHRIVKDGVLRRMWPGLGSRA